MDKSILDYLKKYSTEVKLINRLLVSTFLTLKVIKKVKNSYIQSFIIMDTKSDEWNELIDFLKLLKKKKNKFVLKNF